MFAFPSRLQTSTSRWHKRKSNRDVFRQTIDRALENKNKDTRSDEISQHPDTEVAQQHQLPYTSCGTNIILWETPPL